MSWKLSKHASIFTKGDQVCLALSNMHSMLRALSRPLDWLDWESMSASVAKTSQDMAQGRMVKIDYATVAKTLTQGAQADVTQLMRKAMKEILQEVGDGIELF